MVVCEERVGPTPIHPEPGRETTQRRGYWGVPWETRSVHHFFLSRYGAVAARRAHNPKVDGSNPSAATTKGFSYEKPFFVTRGRVSDIHGSAAQRCWGCIVPILLVIQARCCHQHR